VISLANVENAVRAWVLSSIGSSIPAANVWFADQPVSTPESAARIVIRIGQLSHVGGPDGTHVAYDSAAASGQEITLTAYGPRELMVSLQAFSPKMVGDDVTAWSLLVACEAGLGLSSIRAALNAAGLGVLREGSVSRIPGIRGSLYEDRTLLEVAFCVGQSMSVKTGYIAEVEGTGSVHSGSDDVAVPLDIE
jgi:hypothetical protein